jgi:uncharacterized protein YcfJ
MGRSPRRVIRYVRGLVAVVVASALTLSSRPVQAQTADTPVGSGPPQLNVFPVREVSPDPPAVIVLRPFFLQTAERTRPAYQAARRSSQGGGSHKIVAGIGGAMLGGLIGVAVGSWMARNSHNADGRMTGGMIGFSVGAVVGAVVMVKLTR